ncbi:MAG: Na+/H+ antiporter NhaC family protein, partial [Pseudomonadota bacterium]
AGMSDTAFKGLGGASDGNKTEGVQLAHLAPKPDAPPRAVNALLPILTLIVVLFAGLYVTGSGETLTDIVGSANSYQALMWASLLSVLVAAALAIGQRILTVTETVDAWYAGVRAMLIAMIVLVLAWALAAITNELHAADFLIAALGDGFPPFLLPALVFVLSALTAFATGSSWGTMGILLPLIIPLAWAMLGGSAGNMPADLSIFYSAVACNLAGAIWGDHCSPISDTTILSSMASGCDHIEHVRTQLPYALLVGGVAVAGGTIPAALGVPWWLLLPACAAALVALLYLLGRSPEGAAATAQAEAATP